MRTLVVGAGALGGYFGGRLLEANRDVTFLVRPKRAGELAARGLEIRSRFGDLHVSSPPTVLAGSLKSTFDLILLSCKAYDLESAMDSFAPAVGDQTVILPLLNGMRHLDVLDRRFGKSHVLGGVAMIAATVNETHEIIHINDAHAICFGELDGTLSGRINAIETWMSGARFDHKASSSILLDMWEKWAFLASLAGSTSLLRAPIGDIVAAPGGAELILNLFNECALVAKSEGYALRAAFVERARTLLTAEGSPMTASMMRDIEAGAAIEADHIIGDLLTRGGKGLLPVVYTGLKAYEARRARTLASSRRQEIAPAKI